jgi:hypothetical protein
MPPKGIPREAVEQRLAQLYPQRDHLQGQLDATLGAIQVLELLLQETDGAEERAQDGDPTADDHG